MGELARGDLRARFMRSLPYLLLLAGAGFLLHVAANFEFRLPPGRLGPDFWPKLILGLLLLFRSPTIGKVDTITTRLPSFAEVMRVKVTLIRSSLIGIIVGIVPGAGATISSFVSYGVEGQYGKRGKELGRGVPEGIVAPQAAATASVGGALIPLVTMGIPGSGATAIIMAAFLLHGMQPGPQVFATSAHIVYPVLASLFVGAVGMCLIGYLAIRPLVKVLQLPEALVSSRRDDIHDNDGEL